METKQNSTVVVVLILAVIVVAGYFLFRSQINPSTTNNPSPSPTPSTNTPAVNPVPPLTAGLYAFDLKAVGSQAGKVDGSLSYKDGTLSVGIRAQNLPEPAAGKFYQGWLMVGTTPKSLGKLYHPEGAMKADFVTGMENKEELKNYDKVVVSLESTYDGVIETPLFESPVQQSQ